MRQVSVAEIGWNRKVKGGADKIAWYLYKYLPEDRRIGEVTYWSWKNTRVGDWSGIIHNHTFFTTVGSDCKRLGLPHVATVHAIPPERLYRGWQMKTLQLADRVVAINRWIKDYIVEKYRIDEALVDIIPNGAPMHRFGRAKKVDRDYFVVGYHGRITKSKGVETLINAVKYLREDLELNVYLRFLGWDYYGIPDYDWITYDGVALDDRRIASWLDGIDLEVLPTFDDQQPLTVIEALLRGTPVLVTKLEQMQEFSGLVEWIDDPRNSYEVAFKIQRYMSGKLPNTAKVQKLAIQRFGIERMVRDYANLFSELI